MRSAPTLVVCAAAVAAVIVLVLVRMSRRRRQARQEPGRSIVDEWGVESFPASDPPQNW